jgi:hypothetical protein
VNIEDQGTEGTSPISPTGTSHEVRAVRRGRTVGRCDIGAHALQRVHAVDVSRAAQLSNRGATRPGLSAGEWAMTEAAVHQPLSHDHSVVL